MRWKKRGHLTVKKRRFLGLLTVEAVGRSRHQRERKIWEAKCVLFCSYTTLPTQQLQAFPWSRRHLWASRLLISIPRSTFPTWEAKFLLDIFIWMSHGKLKRSMFKDVITIPLKSLLPLHFLYKWMALPSTQSSQEGSFIHSLADLKKYLFYSVPDNVGLMSI